MELSCVFSPCCILFKSLHSDTRVIQDPDTFVLKVQTLRCAFRNLRSDAELITCARCVIPIDSFPELCDNCSCVSSSFRYVRWQNSSFSQQAITMCPVNQKCIWSHFRASNALIATVDCQLVTLCYNCFGALDISYTCASRALFMMLVRQGLFVLIYGHFFLYYYCSNRRKLGFRRLLLCLQVTMPSVM